MKILKALKVILFALLILIFALIIAYFVLRHTGKESIFSDNTKKPVLTPPHQVEEEVSIEEESDYSVRYNGKKYAYNESMVNFLFMGIDNRTTAEENDFYTYGGQADVLLLGCMDTLNKKIKLISIPRDTVTEIELFDYYGNSTGTGDVQIALSYAYGDGGEKSCTMTSDAVSNLLYGLPIHAWYSLNVVAVETVNDAVGGVEVMVTEQNKYCFPSRAKVGEKFLLQGYYARQFISTRGNLNDSSRRAQQKEYLTSFVATAKKALAKNPLLAKTILENVADYSVTNLSVNEMLYLVDEVLKMEIDTDFITLQGEETIVDNRVRFIVDEKALYEMMLDIFYLEVE